MDTVMVHRSWVYGKCEVSEWISESVGFKIIILYEELKRLQGFLSYTLDIFYKKSKKYKPFDILKIIIINIKISLM